MDNNKKYFNIYVFLTTFARGLLEVFIGSFLYKLGFSLREVIYYYVLVMGFSIVLAIPCSHMSKKYSNKVLSIIGILAFFLLQIVLNIITKKNIYLYLVAFLFALYRRAYWIARRYYTLKIIDDKNNISKNYSTISMLNQLGSIVSSYIGALFLQYFNVSIINIISFILLEISTYYLYQRKFEQDKNDIKLNLFETFKCIPKTSIMHIGCYELQVVVSYLFPLFIIIYVKDTYTAIGIINVIASVASLIFTYLYGRLINKERNYLKLSIILFLIVKVLQINSTGIILVVASFTIGFITKMYEQSFQKEHILLSKNFEYNNYNYAFETIQNVARFIVFLILYLFVRDIKSMLYITLIVISSSLFVSFKTYSLNKNSDVMWKEK